MYYNFSLVSLFLLLLGLMGIILNRGHLIIMLMSIELILLAASFLFLINSIASDILVGQFFTILILTVAAAESAIGLGILVAYYRIKGTIAVKSLNWLRG
uniref:NADH-ubiquinone oxidoreductase chain 4L n=1 Tax=Nanozoanthus harenaceus TaxID=1416932 RepID=A0A6C0U7K9_9CNID|nr:NADH dehydrogenase subunit 4L [Nanozoanthus harenaceus]QIB71134.1 NADH dehydrogenase subunit 4L [Nanozoanthus harenaceus]